MAPLGTDIHITGAGDNPGSERTRRRRARYRVGCEGRISHLKRAYHAGRSALRGIEGVRTHQAWAVFSYNLDTLAGMNGPKRARSP